jgi:glyoxylase-like metal-dependent hydrolase (beta-lactamase superfamily II)
MVRQPFRRVLIGTLLVLAHAHADASSTVALAPGVTLVPGHAEAGQQPDGNSVAIATKQGYVVVDTGRRASHAQKLVDLAREDDAPIVAIVNTHWHLDHVSGNPLLKAAFPGLRVHASNAIAGAMTGFLADYRAQLEAEVAKAPDAPASSAWREEIARIDAGRALFPDEVLSGDRDVKLGGRRIGLHVVGPAATAGDTWLYDRESRVLVAGDLVTLPAPFLDTACPSGWRRALDVLAEQPFELLVPGHGAPMKRAAFDRYRTAFGALLDCGASDVPAAQCIDGWLAGVGDLVPGRDAAYARSLLEYYLAQSLRGDPKRAAQLCAGS